jgi:hypothetical protein
MNLVQQANFLEDVPKDQLVSMSQDPNAQFPAFLVLSEIQRRTTNEKNYQAMVNQPTTTVAEEVVSDFAQPTGLQGGAPQATPLPTNISAGLSGAPTAPMQMAASGGVTGYATGDMTALPAGSAPMIGAGMGMDALGDNLEAAIEQYGVPALKTLGIINDDGSVNYGTAALQALSINPAFRLGKAGLGIAGAGLAKYAPSTMNRLKGLFTRTNPRLEKGLVEGQRKVKTDKGYKTIDTATNKTISPTVFSAGQTAQTLGNIALPTLAIGSILPDGEETITEEKIETPEEMAARIRKEEQEKYQEQLNELKALAGAKENKGDYRDLVRLGAGIMSAKNIGDIGTAVTGVLDAQDKRGLVGLQGELTRAQISKLEADIAAMPVKEIQSELSIYSKLLDQIKENSTGTKAEIKQIQSITDYISALGQELMTARGINFAALDNKTKLLEASGIGKV